MRFKNVSVEMRFKNLSVEIHFKNVSDEIRYKNASVEMKCVLKTYLLKCVSVVPDTIIYTTIDWKYIVLIFRRENFVFYGCFKYAA